MNRRLFLGCAAGWAALAASGRQWPLGAATATKGLSFLESLALLAKLRFPVVEIHPMGRLEATPGQFPGFQFDRISEAEKPAVKAALRPFAHVTTHLPYTGLDYFAADEAVAEAAVKVVDTALEGSAYFGARMAVLHPKTGTGQTLESQWPVMLKRFRRWGDMAAKHGMRIGLETGYPQSIRDYVRLVKEVDHPAVGATIDVGHQSQYAELVARVRPEERSTPAGIKAYNDTTLAIVEALGKKVFHFHVHDIDPATWKEHQPLGSNFVDYRRLFALLNKIGYQGCLVFEIGGDPTKMEGWLRDGKARLEALMAGRA